MARIKSSLMVALIALLVIGGVAVTGVGVAHASAEPVIVQTAGTMYSNTGHGSNSTHVEATFGADVTAGDELVALFSYGGGNDCGSLTFSDFEGNTWTTKVTAQDGIYDTSVIATAPITTGGFDLIDVNMSNSCGLTSGPWVQFDLTSLEVSGQASGGTSGTASLTENGSGGTTHATNSGLAISNDDLDLAIYTDGGSNTALSLPSGETFFGRTQDSTVNIQYGLADAEAQSSMTFDTSGSAGYAAVAAISIASV